MVALALLSLNLVAALFKSKSRLEAENASLRQQLIVLRRKVRGRVQLTRGDRLFFVQLYRCFPSILKVITIVRPEMLVRWHREGFRRYWRWKSCTLGGRPPIGSDLRALIRRVSQENPLWGAPRVHGELLKLGFAIAQSTVAKYMVRRRSGDPAGQSWATLLRNHAPQIAAMDLFVVPTIVKRVPIVHWTRIRPYRVLFSGSGGLRRERSSAGCITNTSVSEFSVHTAFPEGFTAFPEGFTAKCGAAVRRAGAMRNAATSSASRA